ncbi:hypothetical protein A2U01_0016127 [Trifolium medium]|uniref:Uncharacterized protein n=1 Tax=Trifolium medium TaxID=97028 RepID=A0A392N6E8_9FABA|nr:hypothetical protein [Trifolium medium]
MAVLAVNTKFKMKKIKDQRSEKPVTVVTKLHTVVPGTTKERIASGNVPTVVPMLHTAVAVPAFGN